jgi:hypothetical protein
MPETPLEATETNYDEVVSHFAGRSNRAARRLEEWRADPDKRAVVPFVEQTRTVMRTGSARPTSSRLQV